MAAAAPAPPTLSTNHPVADGEDSNLSSPLSEVDDKDEELDDPHTMNLDHPAQQEAPSDSDALSEANDTEAETERLYDTPQASRQKNLVLSQIDEEDATETTPTKPSTVIVTDRARDADDSLSDVDMSAPPSSPPEEPLSPTKATRSPSPDENSSLSGSKKRKRSPVADRSDSEAPLRKRAGSVGVSIQEAERKISISGDGKLEELKSVESSAVASPVGHDEGAEGAEGVHREDSPAPEPVVTKKVTRNGSKQAKAATSNGADNQEDEGTVDNEVEGRKDDEGLQGDVEEDLDTAAKHDEEEAEKKRIAVEEWTAIEQKFNVFRDRLYKDRLEKLEREEQALTADEPYHAEYLNMKQCLDELHEEKVRKINKEYEYTLAAHDEVAVSRRAMIWGQFYQGVREARLGMLSQLNQEWHDTQNARRHAHSSPDYALLFPSSPAQRVRNAVAYNTEVSILSGMAIHEGFPAAPTMHGITTAEVEDDLEAIKRARHQRQQSMTRQNPAHSGGLDTAGEQFLRNTPWANASHPNHTKKAVAGSSSEGQGNVQSNTPRVNGQKSTPQSGTDKLRNSAASTMAASVHSPAMQAKRVRNQHESSSSTAAKTSQEPNMARQTVVGASFGS